MGDDVLPREPAPRPPEPTSAADVHATSRSRQKLVCPYCKDLLGATGVMACPNEACGARYHLGCWKECFSSAGRCAIYGCNGGPRSPTPRAAPVGALGARAGLGLLGLL